MVVAILDIGRGQQTKFEKTPPKDHSCHVWYKLARQFQRRRFFYIFPIGAYFKLCNTDWIVVGVTEHNFEKV